MNLTVAICVYNAERYIVETLESVILRNFCKEFSGLSFLGVINLRDVRSFL